MWVETPSPVEKIPLCQDFTEVPVLSPAPGKGSMPSERKGSENMS
jgi:hypothetical protein